MAKETKKGFVLYYDYREHLKLLTDEERGKLLTALLDYGECGDKPELKGAALMAFSFIASQMDRDAERYAQTCRKRSESGKQGGRPPKTNASDEEKENQVKAKKANGFIEKQTEAKKADTDTNKDTDTDTNKDTDTDNPPFNPPAEPRESVQEKRFAEFWEEYPKKVGKQDALRKWNKIKPNAELFGRIMQAVKDAKKTEQWIKEGGRFIPNPSTWINQGRWDDELIPADNSRQTNERRASYEKQRGTNEQRQLSGFRMAE